MMFQPKQYSSDDAQGSEIKPHRVPKRKKKTSIYELYEPSELARGHYTQKDAEIRVTDMPERFQVC